MKTYGIVVLIRGHDFPEGYAYVSYALTRRQPKAVLWKGHGLVPERRLEGF